MQLNECKGYPLFRDVEDARLRTSNQAVVMANIYEDHCAGNVISKLGAKIIFKYFLCVKEDDRKEVKEHYERIMIERGFVEVV